MASPFVYDSGYATEATGSSRKPSVASTDEMKTNTPTSVLNGLENITPLPFKGINALRKTVETEKNKLLHQDPSSKILVFGGVDKNSFRKLNESDDGVGSGARYGYDNQQEKLVVTVFPTQRHETFVLNLGEELKLALFKMGHGSRTLAPTGCMGYESGHGAKQPDASYKPHTRTETTAPPSIVFESGYHESLPQLRRDAEWWLTNAPDDVKIVVLVAIRPRNKILAIEKWILTERTRDGQAGTASRPGKKFTLPTCVIEIKIEPQSPGNTTFVAKGGPLVLEFDKVMDRAPVSPETDITFSDSDLGLYATEIWALST